MSKPGESSTPKKEESHAPKAADQGSRPAKGGNSQVAGTCFAHGCKSPSKRLDFCDEHFDHFKFGLIKKTGEQVPDYEKKFGHYLAHKSGKGAHKVA